LSDNLKHKARYNLYVVFGIQWLWVEVLMVRSYDGISNWYFYCSGTGEMINVMLFDEPIRNLGIMREYLVTHCTNKIHL
jgi:hypothetical protein